MKCVLLFLVLLTATGVKAQNKGDPISLHVKEVHRDQDEGTEKGTWIHITAIAESKTVTYALKCDEFLSTEKHSFVVRCFNLSAGKDYFARRFPTAINFWQPEDAGEGTLAVYEIVSEKEK
ncbi:MAG TPA: hypothetical protein VNZ63_03245 [Verrucomicrobiae bacterium]|nr:hypothetical protein [Verrucomicrobiae bacterium]